MPTQSPESRNRPKGAANVPAVRHGLQRSGGKFAAALVLAAWLLVLPALSPVFAGTPTAKPSAAKPSFGYQTIVGIAAAEARKAYEEPKKLPEILDTLSYDQWRNIRFKPEKTLWRGTGLPFQVQVFHPGWLYNRLVDIQIVDSGKLSSFPVSADLFHYGTNVFENEAPKGIGAGGFRLLYPLNSDERVDEVAVFLGASYFRAVAKGQQFGLSARGGALDTALDSGEEFPFFKKFWLVRPEREAQTMTVFALLDSPSLTGAYRFVIKAGEETVMDISATLFTRKKIEKLGIFPLTSMFFYGENRNIRSVDDFRPEVHDSDGLLIHTENGEWLWRPLINPERLLVTAFELNNPKGFGLLQRDRDFDHYQDLEAFYHKRPSVWVTPESAWGAGRIELVAIPTDSEKNDNIVAYWVSAAPVEKGHRLSYSCRMAWDGGRKSGASLGRVAATRTASSEETEGTTYLIDFEGGKLASLGAEAEIHADISVGEGELLEHHLVKITEGKGWRLVFRVKKTEGALEQVTPGDGPPLELRTFLRLGDEVLTETWSYVDPF